VESTYGRYGDRWKTQNMKMCDFPTAEELIQKPESNRGQYGKGIRNK
jgi:hypothetical protein